IPRWTRRNQLLNVVYKPVQAKVKLFTADNVVAGNFVLVPGIGETGFLLSPLLASRQDYAHLASSQWRERSRGRFVTRMLFSAPEDEEATNYFDPEITVR